MKPSMKQLTWSLVVAVLLVLLFMNGFESIAFVLALIAYFIAVEKATDSSAKMFDKKEISEVAKGVAEAFERGELSLIDVSPNSVSELGTSYLGKSVRITWYPGKPGLRHLRTLTLDGTEGIFPDSADSEFIFKAALRRADRLIDDKMDELESIRQSASS